MEREKNHLAVPHSQDEYILGFLIMACTIFSWIFLHRWNQRNKKGPKTWPLVGAAIEQLMNFDRMHDWLVNYLAESRTVVVPMPFTTYTYVADPENNITDKSLRDVVLNFVIAGRDTTATTLSWALYMVMTHDHVAENLYTELKDLEEERAKELKSYETEDPHSFNQRAEQFAGLLNYDSLGKLYYLHAVITETLRLYPAVPQVSIKGHNSLQFIVGVNKKWLNLGPKRHTGGRCFARWNKSKSRRNGDICALLDGKDGVQLGS